MAQSPDNITFEQAEIIFKKNDENIVNTLAELWDLEEPVKKIPDKWDEIRETCDAFDKEMGNFMLNLKNKNTNTITNTDTNTDNNTDTNN